MKRLRIFKTGDRNYDLYLLLANVYELLLKARERELRQHDMTLRQALILWAIHTIGEKATPSMISRMLMRAPNSVSAALNRMEKAGLVVKNNDPAKKNVIRLSLTDRGQRAYSQSAERTSINNIMSSLSKTQFHELSSLLRTLQQVAQKELTSYELESAIPFVVPETIVRPKRSDNL